MNAISRKKLGLNLGKSPNKAQSREVMGLSLGTLQPEVEASVEQSHEPKTNIMSL